MLDGQWLVAQRHTHTHTNREADRQTMCRRLCIESVAMAGGDGSNEQAKFELACNWPLALSHYNDC